MRTACISNSHWSTNMGCSISVTHYFSYQCSRPPNSHASFDTVKSYKKAVRQFFDRKIRFPCSMFVSQLIRYTWVCPGKLLAPTLLSRRNDISSFQTSRKNIYGLFQNSLMKYSFTWWVSNKLQKMLNLPKHLLSSSRQFSSSSVLLVLSLCYYPYSFLWAMTFITFIPIELVECYQLLFENSLYMSLSRWEVTRSG